MGRGCTAKGDKSSKEGVYKLPREWFDAWERLSGHPVTAQSASERAVRRRRTLRHMGWKYRAGRWTFAQVVRAVARSAGLGSRRNVGKSRRLATVIVSNL